MEVPRGPCPGPRRERRATCAEDDGATSGSLHKNVRFAFLVSPSPVGILGRLPAVCARSCAADNVRRNWLRTGFSGAFAARECSQEEGKEEGKEPSLGARERSQAVVRAVRPGRTTRVPHLRAQPASGRLQVGTPIIGVNLGSLEPTPASTGTESRVDTRDSHCKHGVEKVRQGQSGPMPSTFCGAGRTSKPDDNV